MLLRGGRRELAVVALDVDGEGVEFVGDDEEAAVCAPVRSGVSVNDDILSNPRHGYQTKYE